MIMAALACAAIWIARTSAAPAVPPWRLQIPWSTDTARITIGDEVIDAQIADTGDLRSRGLGYRDGLAPGTGMLFVYNSPSVHTFWMKGMRFCLDIIWIEEGEIKGAAESVCPVDGVSDSELPRYESPEPVTYVLELPAGWMKEHGFAAGQPVEIEFQ
jgi:uncharacterized membrane protein (UPF0127 family)